MDEREVINRLQQGDISALDDIVTHYQVKLTKAMYLIVRDLDLAKEIVQEAFVRTALYIKDKKFDSRKSLAPFLYKTARNLAIDTCRDHKRCVSLETISIEEGGSLSSSFDAKLDAALTNEEIWAAIEQLPVEQRAALVDKYFWGYSEREIAERMKIPIGTVKSRLFAARQYLTRALRPDWSE
jgi:RNA polymerase sigma-70 factor, ECF subfamily